jgi:carboxypeptidase C (cathepsin A)
VDQPVGTGFSHTKDRYFHNNIYDVARDMRVFLREFFKIFPEHTNNEVE